MRPLPPDAATLRPLRHAQVGLRDISAMDADRVVSTCVSVDGIEGPIDTGLLQEAIRTTAAEADCARARYWEIDGDWFEEIAPASTAACGLLDFRDSPDPQEAAEEFVRTERLRPFDLLGGDPLYRTWVLRLADEVTWWVICCHHVVADGYSAALVRERARTLYLALLAGQEPPVTPLLPLAALDELPPTTPPDLGFWRSYLEGTTALLEGWNRSTQLSPDNHHGETVIPGLRAALTRRYGDKAWPLVAIATIADVVADESASDEAVLGMVLTGRRGPVELNTPGQFMTVLPLRLSRSNGNLDLAAAAVRQEVIRLRPHDHDRAEDLRRELPSGFRTGRIFGPIVNIMPFEIALELPGCRTWTRALARGPIEDATITVTPVGPEDLLVEMQSNPWVHTREAHESRFGAIVAALSAAGDGESPDRVAPSDRATGSPREVSPYAQDRGGTPGI